VIEPRQGSLRGVKTKAVDTGRAGMRKPSKGEGLSSQLTSASSSDFSADGSSPAQQQPRGAAHQHQTKAQQ
jgi:hypothetical protein